MRLVLALVLALLVGTTVTVAHVDAASVVGQQNTCIQRSSTTGVNQAGLVVTFGDGRTLTFCIEFGEDTITGAELLQRSGLSVVTATSGGLGAAVCSIDGEGCNDPGDCFCKCKGGTCEYWAYYQHKDGAWQYSPVGAGNRTVHNGDADAWVWGGGGDPPTSSGAICPDSIPSPSPVSSPTSRPSATPRPSATTVSPEDSPTVVPPPVPTSTTPLIPAPPAQPEAAASMPPTSVVLSEARTPPASSIATSTPRAGSTQTKSATPSRGAPTGALRVSDAEGERNLAGQQNGGDWNWRSIVAFAGVAAVLVSLGGVVVWRRRAGL